MEGIKDPAGVLVLSPGANGMGDSYLKDPKWIDFARKHRLGLVGLSFASKIEDLHNGKGYYYPDQGSGKLLTDGLRKIFKKDLPVVLYGFSGGAHFSGRFAEWMPERVRVWSAYSSGWQEEPKPNAKAPPGLLVCGDEDERYGATLMFFKQGRAVSREWAWLSVGKNGHSPDDGRAVDFIRQFMPAHLASSPPKQICVDIDLEKIVSENEAGTLPALTEYLTASPFESWREINQP